MPRGAGRSLGQGGQLRGKGHLVSRMRAPFNFRHSSRPHDRGGGGYKSEMFVKVVVAAVPLIIFI